LGTLPPDPRIEPGLLGRGDIARGGAGAQRLRARERAIDIGDEMGPVLFDAFVKGRRPHRWGGDETDAQNSRCQERGERWLAAQVSQTGLLPIYDARLVAIHDVHSRPPTLCSG